MLLLRKRLLRRRKVISSFDNVCIVEGAHPEDHEHQDQDKEDQKPPMLALECYDPTTSSYKFVREVHLYKNADFEPFIKKDNSLDFIKDSSFATNGSILILQTPNKAYFFDMKTGVRIQKANLADEYKDSKIVFDYQNNIFYNFKTGQSNTRMEAFSIANFKKGGVSFGFEKDFLTKRMSQIRGAVFGETSDQINTSSKTPINKLNLIQRIMKNVTTPVLIDHSRQPSHNPFKGDQLPQLLRTLILRHIQKSCENFNASLEELKA